MHRTLLGIAATMALLYTGTKSCAQAQLSFDQNLDQNPSVHEELCEKKLNPPEDNSTAAALGWALQCADLDLRIEMTEFASLDEVAKKGSKAERNAYGSLMDAFKRYRELHMNIETKGCGGGNGCPADMEQEKAQCNYEFLRMAEGFRGAGFPSFSTREAAAADTVLNASYGHELSNHPVQCQHTGQEETDDSCASQSEFRAMERAWIRYRDAWVAYGAIKWPNVTADSWCAYLTLQHTGPHPGISGIGAKF